MSVMIVGGPDDELRVQCLVQELDLVNFLVVQNQDLVSISRILLHAKLFIGHDSGLTHLAAALGIATVVLFGPTDPGQWAPRGDHVAVVRGNECHCSDWDAVSTMSPKTLFEFSDRTHYPKG